MKLYFQLLCLKAICKELALYFDFKSKLYYICLNFPEREIIALLKQNITAIALYLAEKQILLRRCDKKYPAFLYFHRKRLEKTAKKRYNKRVIQIGGEKRKTPSKRFYAVKRK